jgi:dipeptidyl aminopeptidase/acylaminoacyl peptidase
MKRLRFSLVFLLVVAAPALAADGKRPMKIEDLFAFKRVGDPQISPDGKQVVYVVGEVDFGANKIPASLWLAATDGKSEPKRLTNAPGKKDGHPRWSPDGKHILFESNRSGDGQLWVIDLDGGEARQLTTISSEASTGLWSPDGKTIAFVSAVYPELSDKPFAESDAANKKRNEEKEKSPVKAKVFTKLFYRHWNEYVEDKRQHLFVMTFNEGKGGEPKDVTPGDHDANPTSDTFSVGDDFTFSPDGKYILYTAPPEENEAWSTNYDIHRVPVAGGKSENMTKDNLAADGAPKFSPDGKRCAFRRQRRAGFEADRWDLMVVDSDSSGKWKGEPKCYTDSLHRSVDSFAWPGYKDALPVITTDDNGSVVVMERDWNLGVWTAHFKGMNGSLSASNDGMVMACTNAAMDHPAEVIMFSAAALGPTEPIAVTKVNAKLLAELDLPRPESVQVKVEGGEMQMWILKPPGFDPKKKWPLAFLVHGGPQGAWEDGWSYRWCPELWAAQGYVVALPNPRGSTGFGQKFVDEISGDWGGKCYDDLMDGLACLEKQDYIDKDRMAAAGASFGGYMMDWFEGHTDKFKTLITHCGVYNFDSMYALTDELWFDEWEHGGLPWDKDKREAYEKFSPHRYAANFKTPMLIIHNDLDFRVPVAEGHQLFTTLQRKGVPSKFINFPDEGHWVLKPKNSEYWHKEVFAWLAKYAPPGGK